MQKNTLIIRFKLIINLYLVYRFMLGTGRETFFDIKKNNKINSSKHMPNIADLSLIQCCFADSAFIIIVLFRARSLLKFCWLIAEMINYEITTNHNWQSMFKQSIPSWAFSGLLFSECEIALIEKCATMKEMNLS